MKKHSLISQLQLADVTEEQIEELFDDLKYVFDNPFDAAIDLATMDNRASYFEYPQYLPN
jgi:hypothetical protein